MARTRPARRRRANGIRLNLEIVGIAAIALAVLFGIAVAFPHHAGSMGDWTAKELRRLFGDATPLFPVLVALIGGIIFLEISVPREGTRIGGDPRYARPDAAGADEEAELHAAFTVAEM